MKKYNNIQIIDTDGKLIFKGSYAKLLNKFNNTDECNDYIEDCKDIRYADYNEGYTFYYNTKPDINKLKLLLK